MAKVLNAYRGFTAAKIEARADIPDAADTTVVGTTVECENITTTKIKNGMGGSSFSVGDLCSDSNVNVWSGFTPTIRTVSGGVLTNSVPTTNYTMGSFAGYDHSAPTPYFVSGGSNTSVWIAAGEATFSCVMDIGEPLYTDVTAGNGPATHVHFSVWDGSTSVGNSYIALSSATSTGNTDSILDFSQSGTRITLTGLTATKDYTCKVWFSNSSTYQYDESNMVFRMTQFPNWTVTAKYKSANHFIVAGPSSNQTPDGTGTWTDGAGYWDVTSLQLTLSTGTVTMTALKLLQPLGGSWGSTGYDQLDLNFIVEEGYYNSGGSWIGTVVSTSSDYVTNEPWNQSAYIVQIASAFDIWTPGTGMDTSGYGYRIKVNCDCY